MLRRSRAPGCGSEQFKAHDLVKVREIGLNFATGLCGGDIGGPRSAARQDNLPKVRDSMSRRDLWRMQKDQDRMYRYRRMIVGAIAGGSAICG
jgi:hypothetical protein